MLEEMEQLKAQTNNMSKTLSGVSKTVKDQKKSV
jgi:hypothetical protein